MPRKRHKAEEIVAVLVSSSLLLSLASYANVRAEFHLSNLSEFPEPALVSQLRGASTQSGREFPAKLFGPAPDGLVTDDDPTNCEQILDHP